MGGGGKQKRGDEGVVGVALFLGVWVWVRTVVEQQHVAVSLLMQTCFFFHSTPAASSEPRPDRLSMSSQSCLSNLLCGRENVYLYLQMLLFQRKCSQNSCVYFLNFGGTNRFIPMHLESQNKCWLFVLIHWRHILSWDFLLISLYLYLSVFSILRLTSSIFCFSFWMFLQIHVRLHVRNMHATHHHDNLLANMKEQ